MNSKAPPSSWYVASLLLTTTESAGSVPRDGTTVQVPGFPGLTVNPTGIVSTKVALEVQVGAETWLRSAVHSNAARPAPSVAALALDGPPAGSRNVKKSLPGGIGRPVTVVSKSTPAIGAPFSSTLSITSCCEQKLAAASASADSRPEKSVTEMTSTVLRSSLVLPSQISGVSVGSTNSARRSRLAGSVTWPTPTAITLAPAALMASIWPTAAAAEFAAPSPLPLSELPAVPTVLGTPSVKKITTGARSAPTSTAFCRPASQLVNDSPSWPASALRGSYVSGSVESTEAASVPTSLK